MKLILYSRNARGVLDCEKRPLLREFWTSLIPPLDIQVAPWEKKKKKKRLENT